MKNPYFELVKDLLLKNDKLFLNSQRYSGSKEKLIKGKSLLLKHVQGNLGHFLNDHYYSFFGLACWGSKFFNLNFDNILIPAGHSNIHLYLALNLLPSHIKSRVIILDKDIFYKIENAYIPCNDRNFSFKINGKSFISEWRNNFYQNLGSEKICTSQKSRAFIFQHPKEFSGQNSHPGRHILNVNELKEFFGSQNIETEVASLDYWNNKSSLAKVKPFIESNIFIGAYGAWMSTLFLAREKSKIFLLQHPDLNEPWWKALRNSEGKILNSSRWSAEYYLSHELNNYFYNITCDFKPSFSEDGPLPCIERLGHISRSANLIVDIELISNLL